MGFAIKKYDKLIRELESWMKQIPVIGFNSGKYDINLIKNNLLTALKHHEQNIGFTVKKSNSFMCISTENLKFLDILSFLAPGYSYDSFLKAYNCKLQKATFPYEYLDNIEKLKDKSLPKYELWYSKLKNSNITEEEYKTAQKIWDEKKMTTLEDYLIYYNNLDVFPFVEAVDKMREFYKTKQLDLFKDAISLPGLSNKYLFNTITYDCTFGLCDEENKDIFTLLQNSQVGGPSIVFNRYQERDKTKIKNNKTTKKIVGYDANSLYPWSKSQNMPTGMCKRYTPKESIDYYTKQIQKNKLFGFVEVDIHTPQHLKSKYDEFPMIFKNTEIKHSDLSDEMKKYKPENWKTRSLISSHFGNKTLLYTPLLKFYLDKGLKITKIYQILEYEPKKCFSTFVDECCDARRAGDEDKNKAVIAESAKLLMNSAFGRQILNKSKFQQTRYMYSQSKICKGINNRFFKDLNEINEDVVEISFLPSKVVQNVPIQIGNAIFQYSKLRMLEFKYDFMDVYIDDSDYQLCYIDTDSFYCSISSDKLEDLIKPELKEQYEKEKHKWFVTNKFSRRQPGLFKVEYSGDCFIGLNSKSYFCGGQYDKYSCKGMNKRTNDITYKKYKDVLDNKNEFIGKNTGFRVRQNQVMTYSCDKVGLSVRLCHTQKHLHSLRENHLQ